MAFFMSVAFIESSAKNLDYCALFCFEGKWSPFDGVEYVVGPWDDVPFGGLGEDVKQS